MFQNMILLVNLRKHKLKYLTLFLIIVILNLMVFYKYTLIHPAISYCKIIKEFKNNHQLNNDNKIILLWSSSFGSRSWNLGKDLLEQKDFEDMNCPKTSCIITINHSYLKSTNMYDAIVFHSAETRFPSSNVPKIRSPHQRYVFSSLEPPALTKHELSYDAGFYNWTMSYRLDSDIVIGYGLFKDILKNRIINPAKGPIWRQQNDSFFDEILYQQAWEKLFKIAWIVSNCSAISQRDVLVKNLQKYIQIDIYGKCDNLICRGNSLKTSNNLFEKNYKFYLSFENALCTDYITEKFFSVMTLNVIPIVYGGANYEKFAPPHSYIDANAFETPKDLANYLMYLHKNPKEYIKYFWWKQYYEIYLIPSIFWFCKLCEKLHEPGIEEIHQVYRNIKEWWFGNMCHFKPKIQF